MKTTRMLRDLGQSIWLDNITRELLDSGALKRYIDDLAVTGLTSNPTIFITPSPIANRTILKFAGAWARAFPVKHCIFSWRCRT